jgi:hypothetical protein
MENTAQKASQNTAEKFGQFLTKHKFPLGIAACLLGAYIGYRAYSRMSKSKEKCENSEKKMKLKELLENNTGVEPIQRLPALDP